MNYLNNQSFGKVDIKHPYFKFYLHDVIMLAERIALYSGVEINSIEDVLSIIKSENARHPSVRSCEISWIAMDTSFDILDAVIFGKDLTKNSRFVGCFNKR